MSRYVFYSRVTRVFEHNPVVRAYSNSEGDTITETRSFGWFIHLEGSYEALHIGNVKPGLVVGDRVKVTVEKE